MSRAAIPPSPPAAPGLPAADARGERQARLAAALRANLRRRKDQARARAQPDAAEPDEPGPP